MMEYRYGIQIELLVVYLRVNAQLFIPLNKGRQLFLLGHSLGLLLCKDMFFSLLFQVFLLLFDVAITFGITSWPDTLCILINLIDILQKVRDFTGVV